VSDGDSKLRSGASLYAMPTLVLDPQPQELATLIERRRRLDQDLFDEVWEGVLHMNPAPRGRHGAIETQLAVLLAPLARAAGLVLTGQFDVGSSEEDYRVPDLGLHREFSDRVWYPTAAAVLEIVSPGDESYKKFDFYASHGVEEVVIVDPGERIVRWFALTGSEYRELERSAVLPHGPTELARQIDWP
jgi:Uma2 family endonuclease